MCGKHRVARCLATSQRTRLSRNAAAYAPLTATTAILWLPIWCNVMRTTPAPNLKWLTAITAVWTAEGWLYLAVVLDVYSRLVVGWAMASHRDESLVEEARLHGTRAGATLWKS